MRFWQKEMYEAGFTRLSGVRGSRKVCFTTLREWRYWVLKTGDWNLLLTDTTRQRLGGLPVEGHVLTVCVGGPCLMRM
jgi:hypothetical protein